MLSAPALLHPRLLTLHCECRYVAEPRFSRQPVGLAGSRLSISLLRYKMPPEQTEHRHADHSEFEELVASAWRFRW